jgi:predicted thioesterase
MLQIPIGTRGSYTLRVEPRPLASNFKDGILPPVFATPYLVLIMENAALNAVRDYFEPAESVVGAEEIGGGTHERTVVIVGRIIEKMAAKYGPAPS